MDIFEMGIFEKIENGYYNPKSEYPSTKLKNKIQCPTCGQPMKNEEGEKEFKRLMDLYCKERIELDNKFRVDALEYVGLTNHPKADKIYAKAYEQGHSAGYSEVLNCLIDLAELFKED